MYTSANTRCSSFSCKKFSYRGTRTILVLSRPAGRCTKRKNFIILALNAEVLRFEAKFLSSFAFVSLNIINSKLRLRFFKYLSNHCIAIRRRLLFTCFLYRLNVERTCLFSSFKFLNASYDLFFFVFSLWLRNNCWRIIYGFIIYTHLIFLVSNWNVVTIKPLKDQILNEIHPDILRREKIYTLTTLSDMVDHW